MADLGELLLAQKVDTVATLKQMRRKTDYLQFRAIDWKNSIFYDYQSSLASGQQLLMNKYVKLSLMLVNKMQIHLI